MEEVLYVKVLSLFLLSFLLLMPQIAMADKKDAPSAAFVKNGLLWIKSLNGKEVQVTTEPVKHPYEPQWSHDGNWLQYYMEQKVKLNPNMELQNEIWVYNVKTKKHIRITLDGRNA